MANDRKKFLCPSCTHRSSRKGNMKLHIQRWHKEGELLYVDDPTVSLLKGKKNQYARASASNSVSSGPFTLPFHNSFSKDLESLSEFVSQVVEAIEIRRKIEKIQMFYSGNLSHFMQLPTNNKLWKYYSCKLWKIHRAVYLASTILW